MYVVVHIKTTTPIGETPTKKIKVYYARKRNLARNYVAKRFSYVTSSLEKKVEYRASVKIIAYSIDGNSDNAEIEYTMATIRSQSRIKDEYHVIYASEILDLPNGPGLKIG